MTRFAPTRAQQIDPACFFRLGVRNEKKGITHLVHTPKFDIDHHAIEIGVGVMSYFAINLVR